MKKILVPCDFSETAVCAFRFALDMATPGEAQVFLLHAIELPVMYDSMLMPALNFEESYFRDMKKNAEQNLNKLKNQWAKDGQKVSSFIVYGPPTIVIGQFEREKEIDLIVMGTKGASGMKEFFVGSNTEKIVRTAKMPVIAVKKFVQASSIRNIVLPNILRTDQEELTLKVKDLQKFFNATLHIVYINTPADFQSDTYIRKNLQDFTTRFMIKNCTLNVYNDIDQESGVIHFAHEIGADMIAMATHGRRGLNHLMSGSIAEDVVNHVDIPIWTFVEK